MSRVDDLIAAAGDDKELRNHLKDAVAEAFVSAGADRGYDFSVEDVLTFLREHSMDMPAFLAGSRRAAG